MNSSAISQSKNVRTLERHDHTCQACSAVAANIGGKEKMRVGFIPRNDSSLTLTDADLKTLCPDCDDGFAPATLFSRMNAKDLQKEIHRATVSDQLAVLEWLLKSYSQRETK